tara:strand:+ start:84 stop:1106 length:1023 start_codon:yes stop_codon:yes gene_type:complete
MARYGSTGSLSRMQQMINKVNKGMNNPTANLKTAGGPPPPPNNKQNKPPQGTYSGSQHSYRNIQAAIDEFNQYQHEHATAEGDLRRNFEGKQISENQSGGNITYPVYSDEAKPVITASGKPRIIKDLKQSDKQEKSTMFIGGGDKTSGGSSELYHDLQNNPAITFHKNYRQYMSGGESFYLPQAGLSDAPDLPQLWNVSKGQVEVPIKKELEKTKMKNRVGGNLKKSRYTKGNKPKNLTYKTQPFEYEGRKEWREAKKEGADAISSGKYAIHEDKIKYYKDGILDEKMTEEQYQTRVDWDTKKMEEYKTQYVKWDKARVGLGLQSQPYADWIAKQPKKKP